MDAPRAEPPGPGAELAPSTATRPPTWSGRSSTATRSCRSSCRSCTTARGGSRSTRSCSSQDADQRPLLALARLLHGRHGGAVRLRRVPADDDADEDPLRALHDARARQAGKDALLPRPAPAPRTTREDAFVEAPGIARQGDARLHAALLPVRVQGDQGRLRPRQGHRPCDRPREVRDGEARRPGRADGRHARVHRSRAAARPLLPGAARASSRRSRPR